MALEQNRALVAAKNAELRRAKNVLLTDGIQALEKKVKKGKGLNKHIIADRQEKVREWGMGRRAGHPRLPSGLAQQLECTCGVPRAHVATFSCTTSYG